jgi:hypothetical protein
MSEKLSVVDLVAREIGVTQARARNKAADEAKAHPQFYQGVTKLCKAATLIEEGLALLNVKATACDSCGTQRRHNFEDFKVFSALENMPTKLRKLAEHFRP